MALRRQLDAIAITKPAIDVGKRKAVFVPPTIAAEVEFRAWTRDGKLRHPALKRIREASDNDSVFNLNEKPA